MDKITLVFASNNQHKLSEIQSKIGEQFEVVSLQQIGCSEEIPETGSTLETNASLKSQHVVKNYGKNCFADDSGLEIFALDGQPGVDSAHYAGDRDADKNMDLVLLKMQGIKDRRARFRTVISLVLDGDEHLFEGVVNGNIRNGKCGAAGFGYDPIFEPEGYDITFAEMSLDEKNKISHRAKAVEKLIAFLKG
ncbi:non-canonical purine NTP pyrophosphatase, RdgB/HAM1 family [Pelobium manganitolerans]|uniref:dITP/XTP pyrophosphatase n=1 Tax=Pelobium manganitolerans TaxID=1842495 RepID=A0A419S7E1_9SPHI|nr:RdgB/HAM1 family non-canonical purine NTP pyrophosphatase [Pelobium manganitolerans]RKD17201.1 non-canonical purine NTP pyrophosphatase, RdgB/HAM1 family [Pelobium manganitolerans]